MFNKRLAKNIYKQFDQHSTGKFIAKLRREKGLTQTELGERLGVGNKTVSRWERGNYMPDLALIPELATELGVSVSELFAAERFAEEDYKRQADAALMEVSRRFQLLKVGRQQLERLSCWQGWLIGLAVFCLLVGEIPSEGAVRGLCISLGFVATAAISSLHRGRLACLAPGFLQWGLFGCLSSLYCGFADEVARLALLVLMGAAMLLLCALRRQAERDIEQLLAADI